MWYRPAIRPKFLLSLAACLALLSASACSQGYRHISTANGRQVLIDIANNHLTLGQCQPAIDALAPLVASPYVDNRARLVYSSGFACRGGFNFPAIFNTLLENPVDLWASLILGNYSDSHGDGKRDDLRTTAAIIRSTTSVPGSFAAQYRPADANVFMIFIQAQILSLTIAPLGAANPTTGAQTQAFAAAVDPIDNTDRCLSQVALATIVDSLGEVNAGVSLQGIQDAYNNVCALVPPPGCTGNLDPDNCAAGDLTAGDGILTALESEWQP